MFEITGNDPFSMIAGWLGSKLDRAQDALYQAVGNGASAMWDKVGAMAGAISVGVSTLTTGRGPSIEPQMEEPALGQSHASAMEKLQNALGIEEVQEAGAPQQSPQGVTTPQKSQGFDRGEWELAERMRELGNKDA